MRDYLNLITKNNFLEKYGIGKLRSKLKQKYTIDELYDANNSQLTYSNIKLIPNEIGRLHNLTFLNFGGNKLTSLPTTLGQLIKLRSLLMWDNKLKSLPTELGKLHNLRLFNMHHNKLTTIPTECGQLSNLRTLDLDNNQIILLPTELGQLNQLAKLSLNNNKLISLPSELGQLNELTFFSLLNMREQGGHVTRAGADFEHGFRVLSPPVPGARALRRAAPACAGHPATALRSRRRPDRGRTVGTKFSRLTIEEQIQHVLVEHFPGADLLFDHVETRLLDVHGGFGSVVWRVCDSLPLTGDLGV